MGHIHKFIYKEVSNLITISTSGPEVIKFLHPQPIFLISTEISQITVFILISVHDPISAHPGSFRKTCISALC